MRKLVVAGVFLVVVVQLFAVTQLERPLVLGATGVALAGVLIALRWRLTHHPADTFARCRND